MKINKLTIVIIVLIVWAVFSLVYMANDYWQDFKMGKMQAAYSNGSSQAVAQIIERAKTCEPVNLYAGETQVNLIDVACLQKQAGQGEGAQAEENMNSEEEE